MTRSSEVGFDRIKPRAVAPEPDPVVTEMPTDHAGRQALWSDVVEPPSFGSVTIACSSCEQTSILGLRAAGRAALPSLHLPFIRGEHFSWMRCPACGRRTWVRPGIRF